MLSRIPLVAIGLAVVTLGPTSAQVDPAKALVGTWQGEIDYQGLRADPGRDPKRTLIIESVAEKTGKWVAAGRFGPPESLGRVQIDVDPAAGQPSIAFVTRPGARVRLQLIADKQLRGTFQGPGTSTRGTEHPLKLTRAE